MRFSLNTVCLFPGRSFEEIFPQMKERGFDTFELWSLDGIDLAALKAQKDRFGMRLSACCPSFFILNDERRHEEYEAALRKVAAQASSLDCPSLITQVGQDTGAPRAQQHAAILKGLRRMEPLLREYGLTLLVEPLNSVKDQQGVLSDGFKRGLRPHPRGRLAPRPPALRYLSPTSHGRGCAAPHRGQLGFHRPLPHRRTPEPRRENL